MRKLIALLPLLTVMDISEAQVAVNTDSSTSDNSAMLDVKSSTKGMLVPRMTTSQRIAIINPAKGLLVFDNDSNSFWYYDGSSWGELSSINSNIWTKNGNDVFNTNSGNLGIGTNAPNSTAKLHINIGTSSNKGFLVTGTFNDAAIVPDLGSGSRMMFYPDKSCFRAGFANVNEWDNAKVGKYSVALGYSTIASGDRSSALGSYAIASGYSSASIGNFTTASGFASTAMGNITTASAVYSSAFGEQTIAKGYSSTVVGIYNDPILAADETVISSITPLFIVGNGDSPSPPGRRNALVVRKNGNVEAENLLVGQGSVFSKEEAGTISVGTNGSSFKVITMFFPTAFTSIPNVIATIRAQDVTSFNDTFVVSVRSVTTTSVTFNILRVDQAVGWGQNPVLAWFAWN